MTTRRELANTIRALAMDAVQRANSGHPGMPMGMADIAQVLWGDFLKHNPGNPLLGRPRPLRALERPRLDAAVLAAVSDRLSARPRGDQEFPAARLAHGRASGARAGLGIETTTGPLGQGLANAVGMALAEKMLAAQFNRPGFEIVDHYTYAFAGDGCLMEGISHEACSLAGTLGLGKLIVFYDDNGISIDGKVAGLVRRRHGEALRGLPLARRAECRRPRSGGDRRRDPGRAGRDLPALADLLQNHHRLRRSPQTGHQGGARRSAGRR